MTTDEIIVDLRKAYDSQPLWTLLKAAADRLEELDKREEATSSDPLAAYPADLMEHRHSGLLEED